MNKNLRKVLSFAMAALLIAGACSISMFLSAASETPPTTEGDTYAQSDSDLADRQEYIQAPASAPEPEEPVPEPEPEPEPVMAQEPITEPILAVYAPEPEPIITDYASEPDPESAPGPEPEPLPTEPEPVFGSVSGYLWADGDKSRQTDWNGRWDGGEPALYGCVVTLFCAEDIASYYSLPNSQRVFMNLPVPCAQTRTDANGAYKFDGLKPGYYVAAVYADNVHGQDYLPPVYLTTDNKFTLDSACDAPYIAFSDSMDLRGGQAYQNINAGMRLPEYIAPEPLAAQSGEAQAEAYDEAPAETSDEAVPADIEPAIAAISLDMPLMAVTAQDDGSIPLQDNSIEGFDDLENIESAENNILGETALLDSPGIIAFSNEISTKVVLTVNIDGVNPDRNQVFWLDFTVRNEEGEPQEMLLDYEFSSALDSPPSPYYSQSGQFNTGDDGTGLLFLRHGDRLTVTIPHSDYDVKIAQRVLETPNYSPSYSESTLDLSATNGDTGFVQLSEFVDRNFNFTETLISGAAMMQTNITIALPIPTSNIALNEVFDFDVYLLDESGSPVESGSYQSFTYTMASGAVQSPLYNPASGIFNFGDNGKATIHLRQGNSFIIEDIPSTYQIRIVQTTTNATYPGNFADNAGGGGIADTGYLYLDSVADRIFTFGLTGGASGSRAQTTNVTLSKLIAGTNNPFIKKDFWFKITLVKGNGNPASSEWIPYTFSMLANSFPPKPEEYKPSGSTINFGEDGIGYIRLRHGYNVTLELPSDYTIRVEEIDLHHYQSYTPSFDDIYTDAQGGTAGPSGSYDTGVRDVGTRPRKITFTNTLGPGFTIKKTITNANPNTTRIFLFKVYLTDLSGSFVQDASLLDYTFYAPSTHADLKYPAAGEVNVGFNGDGMATIALSHGYELTLHLREGYKIRVVEVDDPSYSTVHVDSFNDDITVKSADTGTLTATSTPRTIDFHNTRGPGVTITKTISADDPDWHESFEFNIYLRDQFDQPVPQGTLMEYSFEAEPGTPDVQHKPVGNINFGETGMAAYPMRHGYSMTLYLRSDYSVRVVEVLNQSSNYIVSHTKDGGTTVSNSADTNFSKVGAISRRFDFTNKLNRANITVAKKVTGILASRQKDFEFTIRVATNINAMTFFSNGSVMTKGGTLPGSGATAPEGGQIKLDSSGSYTFTLRHGQTLSFDLQGNFAFRVVEEKDTYYNTAFTDSSGGLSGKNDTGYRLVGTVNKTIEYTNTHSTAVPTGIDDSSRTAWVFTAAAALSAMSALVFTAARRRRGRGADNRCA